MSRISPVAAGRRQGPRLDGRGRVRARRHQEGREGEAPAVLPRTRPRREGLRDRQAGRTRPARRRADRGELLGTPVRVARGHCGGQGDVERAGLAQDLARSRVDARNPARAARDRIRWAARHHRAGQEDERGSHRAFGIRCPDTVRLPVMDLRKYREVRLNHSHEATKLAAPCDQEHREEPPLSLTTALPP